VRETKREEMKNMGVKVEREENRGKNESKNTPVLLITSPRGLMSLRT